MPKVEYKKISYTCPECNEREPVDLAIAGHNPEARNVKGRWCSCGARHKIIYQIKRGRKYTNLKVVEFLSNDLVYPKKRFRIESTI